jgi:hypothetical protein
VTFLWLWPNGAIRERIDAPSLSHAYALAPVRAGEFIVHAADHLAGRRERTLPPKPWRQRERPFGNPVWWDKFDL